MAVKMMKTVKDGHFNTLLLPENKVNALQKKVKRNSIKQVTFIAKTIK